MGDNYKALVKSISLDDIKSFYAKRFTTGNLTIGIAGNYSADFLKKLENDMGSLPSNRMAEVAPGKGLGIVYPGDSVFGLKSAGKGTGVQSLWCRRNN